VARGKSCGLATPANGHRQSAGGKAVGPDEGIYQYGNEAGEGVEVGEGNAGAAELWREEIEDRNAIKEL
jgi:hypothetical protein